MTAMLVFDEARQSAFALLSGDHNPLHVDPDQARRSQFGGCVVHGIHIVLAALDFLKLAGVHRIAKLEAQFRAAILVGEEASFTPEALDAGQYRISVGVGGQPRTTVLVTLESVADPASVRQRRDWPMEVLVQPDFESLSTIEGTEPLGLDGASLAALFPDLAGGTLLADVAVLLATTRVVGMRCPGQWALFRRLQWEPLAEGSGPSEGLAFRVASADSRFSMVTLSFAAAHRALSAEVILRQPPPSQVDFCMARTRVSRDLFSDTRGLVIGGSRGLGEVAAKILAAGGAEVLLTYRSGHQDAAKVVAELGPRARAIPFVAEDPAPGNLASITDFRPTHIAYFATPIITKRPPRSWDPAIFDRFMAVYVTGLSRLFGVVKAAGALESLFFPSSTFVEEHPIGFAEYVAAKGAGEALCAAWQQAFPSLRIRSHRLPPLVTDQTSARMNADPVQNLDILLPLLQQTIRG